MASEADKPKAGDDYLAKPSGACCLKGTLHEGKARGSMVTIAGVETYKSEPKAGNDNGHVLLYFADVSVSNYGLSDG